MVEVTAKKRENIDGLLEMILLTSNMLQLKANPTRLATGAVLEAELDRGGGGEPFSSRTDGSKSASLSVNSWARPAR